MNEEERIVKLEIKVTHFERLVQELNDVIYDQQKQISVLKSTTDKLVKRIKDMDDGPGHGSPVDGKPPHY